MIIQDREISLITRSTDRIVQIRLRQALREKRHAFLAKSKAQKADRRRRFLLGGAVISAGLGDWELAEITGLLLDGKARVEHSPTMRLALRKRDMETIGVAPIIQ